MRDGVTLSATLYLPGALQCPAPTVFLLTPYVAQISHDSGVYFASRGLPFLTVDVRGRGNSEGTFTANGNEARDGYDIVEWLAQQPYCNGKVAMSGGSYSGYVQWSAAKERPPHLATIVPVASPWRGFDSPAPRNMWPTYRIQWLNLLGGRTSQERMFADQPFWNQQYRRWLESGTAFRGIDGFLGHPSPIFQRWLQHPCQDNYWDAHNPTAAEYSRIEVPVLTITGMYDGNQLGALEHYRRHQRIASTEHYLIIGPWDHAGTRIPKPEFGGLKVGASSVLDLNQLQLEWYAWTMQGGPKPSFLAKPVAYYVMGADRWRYADTLSEVTAGSLELRIGQELEGNGSDGYVYDPRDVRLASLESTSDASSVVEQVPYGELFYQSQPFARATELAGFFKLAVWLSIDQPDTDFFVAVYEVGPDGAVIQLTTDRLRARYRESARIEKLVTSTEPLLYEFDQFTFVAREVPVGHRLRLVVGPVNSIHWQKNYNSGGVVADETVADARTVTVKLTRGVLSVPLGRTE